MHRVALASLVVRAAVGSEDVCEAVFDLVQLQDSTQTFASALAFMTNTIGPMVDGLLKTYPGSRYGFTTFADKPIPYCGFGSFASYYPWYVADTCFDHILSLSSSPTAASLAVGSVYCSGGNDYAENQIGAMIDVVTDKRMGWDESKVKVVVIVTDSLPHSPGDAKYAIEQWNSNWCLPTMDYFNVNWGECFPESPVFADCQRLGPTYREDPQSLSAEDAATMENVLNLCGPYPYPIPAPAVGMGLDDCIGNDYQTFDQLCDAFIATNAIPVLYAAETGGDVGYLSSQGFCEPGESDGTCLANWYKSIFDACSIPGIFEPLGNMDELPLMINKTLATIAMIHCDGQIGLDTTEIPPTDTPTDSNSVPIETTTIDTTTDTPTDTAVTTFTTSSERLTTTSMPIDTTTIPPTTTTAAYSTSVSNVTIVDLTTSVFTAVPSETTLPFQNISTATAACGKHCLCDGEVVVHWKDLESLMDRLIRAEIVRASLPK